MMLWIYVVYVSDYDGMEFYIVKGETKEEVAFKMKKHLDTKYSIYSIEGILSDLLSITFNEDEAILITNDDIIEEAIKKIKLKND